MPVAEVVASACDLEGDTCFLFTIVLKSKPTLRPFLFPPYWAKGSWNVHLVLFSMGDRTLSVETDNKDVLKLPVVDT